MSWRITGSEKTPVDPQFTSVSLLLHGNGTNGSTTITDSSPTPKTVTAVGNAQISTAQSKFGGASIAFDGTGDAITVPDSEEFNFLANFTIETFLYANSWPANVYLFGQYQGTDYPPALGYFSSGTPSFSASNNNSSYFLNGSGGGAALSTSTWHHVAWVRSGNRWSIYVNGTERLISASNANTPFNSTGAFRIGNFSGAGGYGFNGYLDEFRITKGIARYTANFTPPPAQFPDI
jgi:hypothetical protein